MSIRWFFDLAVYISRKPILPTSPMGVALGGKQGDPAFRYSGRPPLRNDERSKLIAEGDERTLRSLMTGAKFEGANRLVYDKREYLFGDASHVEDLSLCTTEDPWISKVGDARFY